MVSKVYQISNDSFIKLVQESFSQSECLRKLGLQPKGGTSPKLFKKRVKELNLSTSHFKLIQPQINPSKQCLSTICIENSTYTNTTSLKRRLINEQILIYECFICKISEWNFKPLSLQLDHINGINTDNRIENLRLLCPNCHSQTETYAGKNIK